MGQLNKRICSHRYEINHGGNQLLYRHFNESDHSILSMKVRIIEKIYHHTNSNKLSTPYRRRREEHWIKKLCTATPYGCNDKIDSIGNLTSPSCNNINVMNIFEKSPRRKRSHGHRHYSPPSINNISFTDLLQYMHKPLGIHYIRTKLFSISLPILNKLINKCHEVNYTDFNSIEYRLTSIIMDIAKHRLFKPVQHNKEMEEKRSFLKVFFANKGIDAFN